MQHWRNPANIRRFLILAYIQQSCYFHHEVKSTVEHTFSIIDKVWVCLQYLYFATRSLPAAEMMGAVATPSPVYRRVLCIRYCQPVRLAGTAYPCYWIQMQPAWRTWVSTRGQQHPECVVHDRQLRHRRFLLGAVIGMGNTVAAIRLLKIWNPGLGKINDHGY